MVGLLLVERGGCLGVESLSTFATSWVGAEFGRRGGGSATRPTAEALGRASGLWWLGGGAVVRGGLRLMEGVRLRLKDLDFEYGTILVRDGIRLRVQAPKNATG